MKVFSDDNIENHKLFLRTLSELKQNGVISRFLFDADLCISSFILAYADVLMDLRKAYVWFESEKEEAEKQAFIMLNGGKSIFEEWREGEFSDEMQKHFDILARCYTDICEIDLCEKIERKYLKL